MDPTSRALFLSLIRGPLLVSNLEEAATFPHEGLSMPDSCVALNLQQKLGHLYEDALAMLLDVSPHYQLLARNVQLQPNAQTTLGELDFLIRDLTSGQLIHLELATKFYLAVETENGFDLPGPDPIDNYHRKLDRLRTHQLRLTDMHRADLPEVFQEEDIITQQLIYGCLFDSIHATHRAQPTFIHPHCRRGRWLSVDEVVDHFGSDVEFHVIPKSLWPVPVELIEGHLLKPWTRMKTLDRCVMVTFHGEPDPYFITPSHFPRSKPD